MLTVLEPCDTEYRVRALLLQPRQGVTSLLIGDIRVPAAASYPHFRSLSFFFNLFTFPSPPSYSLVPLLCPSCWDLLSLAVCSPPHSSSFAFQVVALCRSNPMFQSGNGEREGGKRDGRREEKTSYAVDAKSRHHIPTSGPFYFFFPGAPACH